ncbi:hypothetical protein ACWAUC_06600 [Bradyrhizobium guangdongense]
MNCRAKRLDALRRFLERLGLDANLRDDGLGVVSAWLPSHCGALVPTMRRDKTMQVFFRHLAPWEGKLRGLNAIFDLAVFMGECVIARNPRAHWIELAGSADDGEATESAFQLGGFKSRRDGLDPMGEMIYLCEDGAKDLRNGITGERVRPDRLFGRVRDYAMR